MGDGLFGAVRVADDDAVLVHFRRAVSTRTTKGTAARIEEQRKVEATIEAEAQRQASNASLSLMYEAWIKDGVARFRACTRALND